MHLDKGKACAEAKFQRMWCLIFDFQLIPQSFNTNMKFHINEMFPRTSDKDHHVLKDIGANIYAKLF